MRATNQFLLAIATIGILFSAARATDFTIFDIGTVGGDYSSATSINDVGQITGSSIAADSREYIFRIQAGSTLQPSDALVESYQALSINNSGQIAVNGGGAFRLDPGSPGVTNLGSLWAGYNGNSSALGINDLGQVVGSSQTAPDGAFHAFRTTPNQPIEPSRDDLGVLANNLSVARAINNLGQVVGYSQATNYEHAFRTAPNQPINPLTDDLHPAGMTGASDATAINDAGQVVRSYYIDQNTHAFRTAPNMPINPLTDDLGTIPGFDSSGADGINQFGDTVGFGYTGDLRHAALWDDSGAHDLNDLVTNLGAWSLTEAHAINSQGQIVGDGWIDGEIHGFVLTPTGIPEPATLVLFCVGIGSVVIRRRRRVVSAKVGAVTHV